MEKRVTRQFCCNEFCELVQHIFTAIETYVYHTTVHSFFLCTVVSYAYFIYRMRTDRTMYAHHGFNVATDVLSCSRSVM